jgi:hypothetical protein
LASSIGHGGFIPASREKGEDGRGRVVLMDAR